MVNFSWDVNSDCYSGAATDSIVSIVASPPAPSGMELSPLAPAAGNTAFGDTNKEMYSTNANTGTCIQKGSTQTTQWENGYEYKEECG